MKRHDRVPGRYTGRRSHSRLLAVCIVLAAIAVVLILVWNLGNIANWFRYDFLGNENPPPVTDPVQEPDVGQNQPDPNPQPDPEPEETHRTGLVLPGEALASASALTQEGKNAKSAGQNAIVIDVKTQDGRIWLDLSLDSYSFMEKVLAQSAFDPKETLEELKKEGLYLVARLSALHDNIAPRQDVGMALTTKGVTWLDWDYQSWINPASERGKQYLSDLVGALADLGFDEILFSDFAFPVRGKTALIEYSKVNLTTAAQKQVALYQLAQALKERAGDKVKLGLCITDKELNDGFAADTGVNLKELLSVFDLFAPETDQGGLEIAEKLLDDYGLDCELVPILEERPTAGLEDYYLK